jgi:hypothetical protein
MPIEIKELHIRVAVNASSTGQPSEARAGTGRGSVRGGEEDGHDAMVAACVEQVMEILESKRER